MRAIAGGHLLKESPSTWALCWMKDITYLRRHGPKATIKRRAAIGPRKGISQEKPGLDIGLKIPKRERQSSR